MEMGNDLLLRTDPVDLGNVSRSRWLRSAYDFGNGPLAIFSLHKKNVVSISAIEKCDRHGWPCKPYIIDNNGISKVSESGHN
jgi:hypothetical protein